MSLTVKDADATIQKVAKEKEREGKYPLVRKWNLFVKSIQEARDTWSSLQEEIDLVGEKELEVRYPIIAQKHLGRFRKVDFHWMVKMFVAYYRVAGGLEEMYIVLPTEVEPLETPKAEETKTKVEEEKRDGSK